MTRRVSQADYQADQCVNFTDFSRKNSRNFLLAEEAKIDFPFSRILPIFLKKSLQDPKTKVKYPNY